MQGSRSTGSAANGANRLNVFNKEWLYLNLQSDLGCAVTVTVSFKSEFIAAKPQLKSLAGNS